MISNGTTRRARRWGNGARLAGGVLLTAAVIGGIGMGHPNVHASVALRAGTEDLAAAPTPTLFPASVDLLEKTAANLANGVQVLSQVDTSGYPNFASFFSSQISTQSMTADFVSQLQGLEEDFISHAGKSAFSTNILLYLYNLSWYFDSTTTLSLNHMAASGIDNNFPFFTGIANMGVFPIDFFMFGNSGVAMVVSFINNLGLLFAPAPKTTTVDSATPATTATEPAAATNPAGIPAPAAHTGDPVQELIQRIDPTVSTQDLLGPAEDHDAIGMQVNSGLGLDTIVSQLLAGEWKSPLPVTTDFFEQFVTNHLNPDAFVNGLPADLGNPIESIAYQLDSLLENTVYATDLNAAALTLWP